MGINNGNSKIAFNPNRFYNCSIERFDRASKQNLDIKRSNVLTVKPTLYWRKGLYKAFELYKENGDQCVNQKFIQWIFDCG